MSLRLEIVPFESEVAQALTRAHGAELLVLYAGDPGSEKRPRAEDFEPPHGCFVVAYDDSDAVGCGGVKRYGNGTGELKRMYVVPEARGRGISRAILDRLEDEARSIGYGSLRLETGTRQHEALGLYRSAGYTEIGCWGAFATDAKSVCLEKRL